MTTQGPSAIAITPDGVTAYIANLGSDNVLPLTLATRTAGSPIPAGNGPIAAVITPDQAPVAALSVTAGRPGTETSFDASASTVRFGTIASYAWSFGDGATLTTTTPTATHVYAAAGTYTATVTETSSGGTSVARVYTGQTMIRSGGPQAAATVDVVVTEALAGGAPTTSTTSTTTPRRPFGTLPATGGGVGTALILPAVLFLALGVFAVARARRST